MSSDYYGVLLSISIKIVYKIWDIILFHSHPKNHASPKYSRVPFEHCKSDAVAFLIFVNKIRKYLIYLLFNQHSLPFHLFFTFSPSIFKQVEWLSLFYSFRRYAVCSLWCEYGKTHSNDKFVVGGYPSIRLLVATMNSQAEVLALCPGTRNQQSNQKVPNSTGPNLILTNIHRMEKQSE